jgi:hypothetical protein
MNGDHQMSLVFGCTSQLLVVSLLRGCNSNLASFELVQYIYSGYVSVFELVGIHRLVSCSSLFCKITRF